METSQLIKASSYILSNAIHFKLPVAKRYLEARFISARYVAGSGYLLKIKFNDGHEDEYELDSFDVVTGEGQVDNYCKALEKEIYKPLWAWNPEMKVYVINFPINSKDTNIWIIGNRQEYFSVYYLNELGFQIRKEHGQWHTRIPEAYEDKPIDKDLLNTVTKALDYYTA